MRSPDGRYHMLVSEMTNSAGMLTWGCNSHVVHTVSDAPLSQPFKRVRTLWKVFAHEPRCTQAPAGEYVCFFSHNPDFEAQGGKSCAGFNGTTYEECRCGASFNVTLPMATYMSYTSDLDGEWSEPVKVAGGLGLPDLNLSPFIFSNGTLLALYRNNQGSNIHITTASDWRDPATYHISQADISASLPEDPFLWRDAKGIFHSLHHAYPYPTGPHAWSDDGLNWHKAPGEGIWPPSGIWTGESRGYAREATFTDAEPIFAGCRERPSLIFDADGVTPIALVNGFSPDSSHIGDVPSGSCRYTSTDYSVTLVQPINQQKQVFV